MTRKHIRHDYPSEAAPLATPIKKICYLIIKAREFDAKVDVVEPEPGSNPTDEGERGVLEDYADDPTHQELIDALDLLNEEEKEEVLALVWLGRGDFEADEWNAALAQARTVHDVHETDYLVGTPLLGDYLEEGIAKLGYSCEDTEKEHL